MAFTPPHDNFNVIPDYAFGRLIYYDKYCEDSCRWVVYDGHRRVRCPSKASAYNFAASQSMCVDEEDIYCLMVAHHHLERAWKQLERGKAARPDVESISVQVRRISDKIDTIISQNTPNNVSR